MRALDYLMTGRFAEAVTAYQMKLTACSDDQASASGLAHAYMGAGRYADAIPWEWRVHENAKKENPDSPGELLYLTCAYWCLEERSRAMELARELCNSIANGTVSMSPDQAGGATFGLILHYMAVTVRDGENHDFALEYLRKLNAKYRKRPTLFRYPVETVKQLLGEASFEDALEAATKERSLASAYTSAESNRSIKLALGIALFHDGALRRAQNDELACADRMKQVNDLGYQTDAFRWYLARHEVAGLQ
jgi:hypothetical protein